MRVAKEHIDMISTVTTSTITTVTTVALVVSVELVAIIALLIFLIQKEVFSFTRSEQAKSVGVFLGKVLNVAIVPLLVSFAFIVVVKVMEVLR